MRIVASSDSFRGWLQLLRSCLAATNDLLVLARELSNSFRNTTAHQSINSVRRDVLDSYIQQSCCMDIQLLRTATASSLMSRVFVHAVSAIRGQLHLARGHTRELSSMLQLAADGGCLSCAIAQVQTRHELRICRHDSCNRRRGQLITMSGRARTGA